MSFPTKREFNELVKRVEKLETMYSSYGKEPAESEIPDIAEIMGDGQPDQTFIIVDKDVTDLLIAAGYTSKKAVAAASDEELMAIKGIGPSTLNKIRAAIAD